MSHEKEEVIMEAKHVTRRFLSSDKEVFTACSDVSLTLHKGKTLGIAGESGCGKSTFLRMLALLDTPDEGEILYRGQEITKLKGEKRRQIRQHIQMVFQDPSASFHPKMKVRDIICEPLLNFKRISPKEKEEAARKLLEMVELTEDFSSRYPHSMSGGQKQRVAIARAIALEPEVIVMDEATSALDVPVQKNMIELIVRLQKEKQTAIVFVAHDLALVQSFAHEIAVMRQGEIVEKLPAEKLVSDAKHPYTRMLLESGFSLSGSPEIVS